MKDKREEEAAKEVAEHFGWAPFEKWLIPSNAGEEDIPILADSGRGMLLCYMPNL